ncbi:kinase-like domain-containing protein [Armillaria borealis]|uniref:Kinase-like domain-containing protein n=1 Tax=Armillaria borealis TaxID=47425 RepID=A0AA39JU84_9AGAR|nr:kinase-like domain-containing protein [Armillaria borealis]
MRIVKSRSILPTSFICTEVKIVGPEPFQANEFTDIWKGETRGGLVCIKTLRLNVRARAKSGLVQTLCQEALVWRNLKHPNILPFLGVNLQLRAPNICLVSPWMKNGNINEFLSRNPDRDRVSAMLDVTQGLIYLHSCSPPIPHLDIRGSNILVTDDERYCLSDCGLALAIESHAPDISPSMWMGSLQWHPPETMDSTLLDDRYITARDIYSLGCTIFEIYAGEPPFSSLPSFAAILSAVLHSRDALEQPKTMPMDVWELFKDCILYYPDKRPSADDVGRRLEALLRH